MAEFICKICFGNFEDENELVPLDLCDHIFHKECLESYIHQRIDDQNYMLVCPEEGCKANVADSDLKVIIDQERYDKFSEFSLNQVVDMNKDMSWCPSADCQFAFIYDPDNDGEHF